MDPLAVHLAMQEALAHMRAGGGPTVIEADVYRYFHQNGPFPGSAFGYRTKEEEAEWRERDPIDATARHLVRRGILTQVDVDATVARAKQLMAELGEVILEPMPGGKPKERRIKADEWPDPAFVDVGVRGDLSEFDGVTFADRVRPRESSVETKFIDAVAGVMGRRMETDPRIVVLGEDVHRLNGGTNGATSGLKDAFPDRVLGTPISENALRRARRRHRAGRPLPPGRRVHVRRLHVGRGRPAVQPDRQGAPHVRRRQRRCRSCCAARSRWAPATARSTRWTRPASSRPQPGWRIVAPSTPFDYVGLMNTALACEDPVLVIEHVDLYASAGDAPDGDFDYYLPVGKAAVRRRVGCSRSSPTA